MMGFALSVGAPGAPLHAAAHSHHPWPDVTLAAQEQAWRDAAHLLDRKWDRIFADIIPKAQAHIARELNLPDPGSIAFAPNTHSLVLRLLSCLPRERPIRVLTTGSEFMSFARQIARLEEAGTASVTRIATEPFATLDERLCEALAHTRHDLVYLSQVFFDSGFVLRDLSRIVASVADSATFVAIDGYHAFMAVENDLSLLSDRVFYLAGGYKYAMAGEGACFMHCPPAYGPRPLDTGWYAGFSALESGSAGVPFAADGSRFLGATFDVSGLYRFNAVQDWLRSQNLATARMLEHVRRIEHDFLAALDDGGGPVNRASLLVAEDDRRGRFLCFRTPRAGAIASALAARNVIVDHRGDRLRVGFGIYHEAEDARRLARALASV
ncbi:MAG TPA: aminotransferase class V-fold PLP-dependent enzyme [Rhizomicrobium sp.]|jgi:selenocysteine lyase/cysteine desulfurase